MYFFIIYFNWIKMKNNKNIGQFQPCRRLVIQLVYNNHTFDGVNETCCSCWFLYVHYNHCPHSVCSYELHPSRPSTKSYNISKFTLCILYIYIYTWYCYICSMALQSFMARPRGKGQNTTIIYYNYDCCSVYMCNYLAVLLVLG